VSFVLNVPPPLQLHRPSHLIKKKLKLTCRVPSTQNDPPVGRIVLDLPDTVLQLIYPLPLVVGVTVLVLRSEMPPLEPVDRSEISLLSVRKTSRVEEGSRTVPVPDVDVLLLQREHRGRAGDEPEELLRTSNEEEVSRDQLREEAGRVMKAREDVELSY